MSTLTVDTVTSSTADSDLSLDGNGTGVVDLGAGYKVGGTVDPLSGVAPGTNGNLLTSNGSAWTSAAAAGGGAWTLLGTGTASGSALIEFTSLIDSTYDQYEVTISDVIFASDSNQLYMRTSADNGSTYDAASDYANGTNTIVHNGIVTSSTIAAINASSVVELVKTASVGNAAGESLSGRLSLYKPSSTTTTKFSHNFVYDDTNGNFVQSYGGGCRHASEAVNAIKFYAVSGNITSGVFRLYGINNS